MVQSAGKTVDGQVAAHLRWFHPPQLVRPVHLHLLTTHLVFQTKKKPKSEDILAEPLQRQQEADPSDIPSDALQRSSARALHFQIVAQRKRGVGLHMVHFSQLRNHVYCG